MKLSSTVIQVLKESLLGTDYGTLSVEYLCSRMT